MRGQNPAHESRCAGEYIGGGEPCRPTLDDVRAREAIVSTGSFMRRYDVNGDGQVGPREMPSGAADRLRPFDRDRDGWVEPNELS